MVATVWVAMTATTAIPRIPSSAGRYSNETGDAERVLVLIAPSQSPRRAPPDALTPGPSLVPGFGEGQERPRAPSPTPPGCRGRWLGSPCARRMEVTEGIDFTG